MRCCFCSDENKITGPVDMAFKGVNGPITIKDSGKGTVVTVTSKGYSDIVVWNPFGNAEMGYDKFVCVEPVQLDPVSIPPGKFKETTVSHFGHVCYIVPFLILTFSHSFNVDTVLSENHL